jgi:DNA-binding MarR family transcriptional regulator
MFTNTQRVILKTVSSKEHTLAEISRQTGLTKPNLSAQLSQLEKEGWIMRRQESKKRVFYQTIDRDLFEDKLHIQEDALVANLFKVEKDSKVKPRLVAGFTLHLTPEQREYLLSQFDLIEYPESAEIMTPELFKLRYHDAEIALIDSVFTFLNEDLLRACKRLKHVVYMGKFSSEYIDKELFSKLGLYFWDLSQPDTNFIRNATLEFLIASVLTILRPTQQAEQEIQLTGETTTVVSPDYMGEELAGKVVGIIGTENSAKLSAPILQLLGAQIILADPDNKHNDPYELGVDRFYSVADLFTECDVVVYTDNYYKHVPRLGQYLNEAMRTRYLLILGEYPYDEQFMRVCRQLLLSHTLQGLHLDYWSMRRYAETPAERLDLLYEVMYFPNVRITPFMGIKSLQSQIRLNDYTIDKLRGIKESYYDA